MVALVDIGGGHKLSPEAAASWFRMVRDGMPTGGVTSSTRSLSRQWDLYNNRGEDGWPRYAAHPLESKHVWRPADKRDRGARALDVDGATRAWLIRHGEKYGWHRPFATVEPWHFEYLQATDKMEDDMPTAKEIVTELLGTKIDTSKGQRASVDRPSVTVAKALTDAATGGLRAWKDLPRLEAELEATRAAVVALAKSNGLDPKTAERVIARAVDDALAGITITLTTGDDD